MLDEREVQIVKKAKETLNNAADDAESGGTLDADLLRSVAEECEEILPSEETPKRTIAVEARDQ